MPRAFTVLVVSGRPCGHDVEPALTAVRHTSRSAPRLKLTFCTTLTSSASVADECSATFVAGSYGAVGSAASGLGPVAAAVDRDAGPPERLDEAGAGPRRRVVDEVVAALGIATGLDLAVDLQHTRLGERHRQGRRRLARGDRRDVAADGVGRGLRAPRHRRRVTGRRAGRHADIDEVLVEPDRGDHPVRPSPGRPRRSGRRSPRR